MDQLITDRGGRSFDSHGHGRHTLRKEKTDPKKQASIAFAKEIAKRVARARADGSCREYALLAAPRFIGILRKELQLANAGEPFLAVDKDLVSSTITDLQAVVAKQLA